VNEAGSAGEKANGIATTLPELALELALAPVQEGELFAAVEEEIADQFFPCLAIHLLGHDAEIETDVDEEGAERAMADLEGDLLGRGEAGEGEILGRSARAGGAFGGARLASGGEEAPGLKVAAPGGELGEPVFEGGGAEQAAGDAGEDQGDVAGAEDAGDEGEAGEDFGGSGVLLEGVGEVPAIGDECVEEADDLADARGLGPIGIGLEGSGRSGGGAGHGRIRAQNGNFVNSKLWTGKGVGDGGHNAAQDRP
jgi:hypothetical protein